jgi:plasmid stabilization system protein ParE
MKVVVRASAALDLDSIFAWISKDNPRAAAETLERIRLRINRLAVPGLSHTSRPGLSRARANRSSRRVNG